MIDIRHAERKYRHIFFDLDRTIWDFDASALQTFKDIYSRYSLHEHGIASVEEFMEVFSGHNERLWDQYRQGSIEKAFLRDVRFKLTLQSFGIDNPALAAQMSDDYVFYSPRNVFLFPHTEEVLSCLQKHYHLHMITNGFEEVQHTKLEQSGLRRFFLSVTTSEEAGVKKPDRGIFDLALHKAEAHPEESIMIGDDLLVDIEGATKAGMDTVYFNPLKEQHWHRPTFEINSLDELKVLLV